MLLLTVGIPSQNLLLGLGPLKSRQTTTDRDFLALILLRLKEFFFSTHFSWKY